MATTAKGNEMTKTTCTVCAKTDCKVGGLHGMLRDRAASAKR